MTDKSTSPGENALSIPHAMIGIPFPDVKKTLIISNWYFQPKTLIEQNPQNEIYHLPVLTS
jgi:hypothetical protein